MALAVSLLLHGLALAALFHVSTVPGVVSRDADTVIMVHLIQRGTSGAGPAAGGRAVPVRDHPDAPLVASKGVKTEPKSVGPDKPRPQQVVRVLPTRRKKTVVSSQADKSVADALCSVRRQSKKENHAQGARPADSGTSRSAGSGGQARAMAGAGYRYTPKPSYPVLARRRGWQGVVILAVTVRRDGTPGQIEIEKSSGYPLLDRAARRGVSRWIFVPARKNGRAVQTRILVPVRFILDKS